MAYNAENVRHALESIRARQKIYEAEQYAAAQDEIAIVDDTLNRRLEQARETYGQAAEDANAAYRTAFDANAVSEAVGRRNAAEAMANANWQNSGVQAATQEAIVRSRDVSDTAVTEEKEMAVQTIMQELDALEEDYRLEAETQKRSINNAYDRAIEKNWESLQDSVETTVADSSGRINKVVGFTDKGDPIFDRTFGEMTTKYGDYTGWEAGLHRVYNMMKHMYDAGAFGVIGGPVEEGESTAEQLIDQMLSAYYQSGALENAEAAARVKEALLYNEPLE